MANPVGFEGSNKTYYAPKGMENCGDLQCFVTPTETISCWRLTDDELEQVNKTGVVWLSISGHPTPPSLVSGTALVQIEGRPVKAEPYIPNARLGGQIKEKP